MGLTITLQLDHTVFMDVKTAGRTVDLFEVFATARRPLTMSEVARALNAPQSSCFNLLRALEAKGYLYAVGGKKQIYPTRKLLNCAEAIADFDPIIPRLQPVLEAIRAETDETVILGSLQKRHVVYLAVAEGQQTIRYISHAGEIKPLHASAIGKSLLMGMPEDDRIRLVSSLDLHAITGNTLTSPAEVLKELKAAEAVRYTKTVGEGVMDVAAVACPLKIDGLMYGVAVAGPSARVVPAIANLANTIQSHLSTLENLASHDSK